jgi:hypothetical protein
MVCPRIDCGFFMYPAALSLVARRALPADSSFVRPIVRRL